MLQHPHIIFMGRIVAKLGVFGGREISRDIRAGICGLPVGFRTHEGIIGAPVVGGTVMEGLRTTFT